MTQRTKRIRLGTLFSILALLSALLGPAGPLLPASAASTTWTVSTCDENSLVQAISSAASGDTITFSCSGTIALQGAPAYVFLINKNLTIDGIGQNVSINGGGQTSAFFVSQNVTLVLNSLTFTNGMGGTYSSCQTCDQFNYGGVITNEGTLTVKNSTFSGNQYSGLIGGGVILNTLGTVSVFNSTFSGNSTHADGAGIFSAIGTLTVSNSTFSGNTVSGLGGGIDNVGGTATISGSTFSGNTADAWAGEGVGAGVANSSGTMTITNSTFSGNNAEAGGAIGNSGTLTVTNSTLVGNHANWYANGIMTGVRDSIYLAGGGTTTIKNTILANGPPRTGLDPYNFGGNCVTNGTLINGGGNFDDDGTCGVTQVSTDSLKLGTLTNNGGSTQTIALASDSVAADAVTCVQSVTTDQRGLPRKDHGETTCDSGAYEFQDGTATALSAISGSGLFGSTATLTAKLTSGGTALANKTIAFSLDGTAVGSASTNASGVATLSNVSLSGFVGGSHPGAITAVFNGDGTYAASIGSGTLTVTADFTPPVTTASATNADTSPYTFGSWTHQAVTVSLSASDTGGSGLASTFYSVDGGSQTTYTTPFTLSTAGSHTVSFWSTDHAGNQETPHQSVSVNIDLTAPTTSASAVNADTTPYTFGNWTHQAVTVTLTPSDAGGSGTAGTYYTVDGNQQTYTTPFTINAEGTHTVTFWSVDKAGNEEIPHHSVTVMVDLTAPTTSASATTAGNSPYTFGQWTNQAVTVTLTPSDTGGSGLAGTVYTVDGGASTTYTAPFAVSSEGDHIVAFGSTDQAGNVEAVHTVHVLIDVTNPTISGAPTVDPNSNGWYNAPVTIHWTCGDALSGIAACPSDQTISTEGTAQTVNGGAVDQAGNSASATSSPAVNIDLTAPIVTYSGNQGTYGVNDTVNITCAATDALSGVASSTCHDITGPATSFAFGTNTFSASATDNAGNVGSNSISFSVVPPASTAWSSLTAVSANSPALLAYIHTGRAGSVPSGYLSYKDSTVSLSNIKLLSLTVVGIQATVYGTAELADGSPVSFRLETRATYPDATVRLRLNTGYDSSEQRVSFVSMAPSPSSIQ